MLTAERRRSRTSDVPPKNDPDSQRRRQGPEFAPPVPAMALPTVGSRTQTVSNAPVSRGCSPRNSVIESLGMSSIEKMLIIKNVTVVIAEVGHVPFSYVVAVARREVYCLSPRKSRPNGLRDRSWLRQSLRVRSRPWSAGRRRSAGHPPAADGRRGTRLFYS